MIVFRVIATVQRTIFYCWSWKVALGSQIHKVHCSVLENLTSTDSNSVHTPLYFIGHFVEHFVEHFVRHFVEHTILWVSHRVQIWNSLNVNYPVLWILSETRLDNGHKENRISIFVVNMHSICIYIEWQWQSWAACHGHWACNEIKKLYFCICVELQQWLCWAACSGQVSLWVTASLPAPDRA